MAVARSCPRRPARSESRLDFASARSRLTAKDMPSQSNSMVFWAVALLNDGRKLEQWTSTATERTGMKKSRL